MQIRMEPIPGLSNERRDQQIVVNDPYVINRLEEAGATLLALPQTGYSTRLRTSSLDIVRTAMEVYGQDQKRASHRYQAHCALTRWSRPLPGSPALRSIGVCCAGWSAPGRS